MWYKVHYSGYYGFTVTVKAENKEEAQRKADALFDDVDPSEFNFEPSATDVFEEE